MKILKILGASLLVLVLLAAAGFGAAAWMYCDIPAAELEARYLDDSSRFLNLDGVRIHYRDQGAGQPLLLIHANFSNLIDWDPVVAELVESHRVIRFDMPSHGLTGPDPSGDYSLARTIEITERFVDALGLERFSIGGTSLGGTVSLHYASRHPERIEQLVLLSPGALEGREQARRGVPDSARVLEIILPRALPEFMLRSAWGQTGEVPEAMIDRWHDMWLREGQRAAQLDRLSQYDSGDLEGIAGEIEAPTLLLWGEANPQAKVEQAYELEEMLTGTETLRMIIYPGVGHMAYQEAGTQIGRDIRAWLAGELPEDEAAEGPEGDQEPEQAARLGS